MKKILFTSIIAIILASCTTIGYETPVPKNTESLKQFPKEMIGIFYDGDKDTLRISETNFVYGRPDSTIFYMNKSLEKGAVELKKFNDYYILNIKSENADIWGIIPFTQKKDKITIYFANLDTKKEALKKEGDTSEVKIDAVIEKLDKITPVKSLDKENSEDKDYIINPSNEELKALFDKAYYTKAIEFNRIK